MEEPPTEIKGSGMPLVGQTGVSKNTLIKISIDPARTMYKTILRIADGYDVYEGHKIVPIGFYKDNELLNPDDIFSE